MVIVRNETVSLSHEESKAWDIVLHMIEGIAREAKDPDLGGYACAMEDAMGDLASYLEEE